MDLTIGILSGGKSTRMGADKAKLLYKNKTFLENLVDEFKCYPIIISNNNPDTDIAGYKIVRDKYENIGPISGILEILKEAETENVFIVGVDMQFMTLEVAEFLSTYMSTENRIITFEDNGKLNPLGSIYPKNIIPVLEERISNQEYKLMDLLYDEDAKKVPLKYSKFNSIILSNINYPSQYKKLLDDNIICICGRKNSGKTTFISNVINLLSTEGYKIKYIKHDGHDFTLDEDRDSNIAFLNGAITTVVYSDYKYQIVEKPSKSVEYFLKDSREYDLVIIEGLKDSNFNKYEIVRKGNSNEIISSGHLKGIITDLEKKQFDVETFDLNDASKFVEYLKKEYL